MFIMNNVAWNVVFVPPDSEELVRSDGSRTIGMTNLNKHAVFISDRLQGPFLRKVFLHELCHAAVFSYNISISIDQEELICDFMANFGDEIIGIADDLFAVLKKYA